MDWARAIERNSEALNRIVAALFAMLGIADAATPVARIPQPLHRAVLRVLRPAESAMRRLIVIAARGLVVELAPSRPKPAGPIAKGGGRLRFSFQLFDPRKNGRWCKRSNSAWCQLVSSGDCQGQVFQCRQSLSLSTQTKAT